MTATAQFEELPLLLEDQAAERAALAADGYFFRLLSTEDGLDLSSANATVEQVVSAVFAGATAEVSQYENLSATLPVQVVGADSGGMAKGAAALEAVCRRSGMRALTFQSGDGASRPTVFDVLVATWKVTFDDQAETFRNVRTYILTLTCKPFPRSATPVTVPALTIPSVAPTLTLAADGTSTTGWSTPSRKVSRTNLIMNPSFETGITGWVAGSHTSTIERVSGGAVGSYALQATSVASIDVGERSWVPSSPIIGITSGQQFAVQARINPLGNAASVSGRLLVRFYDGAGSQVGSDLFSSLVSLTSNTFTTVSGVFTAPSGATQLRVWVGAEAKKSISSSFKWKLDAVMVEQASSVAAYFDGDTAASGTTEHAWSGTRGNSSSVELVPATVTSNGTQVSVTGWRGAELSHVGTVNLAAAGHYLKIAGSVAMDIGNPAQVDLYLSVAGMSFIPVMQSVLGDGSFTLHFLVAADSISSFDLNATPIPGASPNAIALSIGQVYAATSLPLSGTGRSGERTIQTYGTMPAEASLTVSDTSALGPKTIVYTAPPGTLSPALRQYRTAGLAVTASSNSLSGGTEPLATNQAQAVGFTIDTNKIPRSSYLLMAHLTGSALASGTSYTISWAAFTIRTGATVAVATTGSTVVTATGTTQAASLYELGMLTLPTWDIATAGTQGTTMLINIWVSGGTWTLDEGWLFDIDNGDLSILDIDVKVTGTLRSIQIMPASADRPTERYLGVYSGGTGTATMDLSSWVRSWSQHRFDPASGGNIYAYLANDAAAPHLSMSAEFFPRWGMFDAMADPTDEQVA